MTKRLRLQIWKRTIRYFSPVGKFVGAKARTTFMLFDSVFEEKSRNLHSVATDDFYGKRRPQDYFNKLVCETFSRGGVMRQSRGLVLLVFLMTTLLGGPPASADEQAETTQRLSSAKQPNTEEAR